jgi:hypothetical protein
METAFRTSVKTRDLPSQRKMNDVLRAGLGNGGVDVAELERLYRQSTSEFKAAADKALAKTKKHSAALAKEAKLELKNLQARVEATKNVAPAELYLIETATDITANGFSLTTVNRAPQNNFAEFEFGTNGNNYATVDFTYQWTNPKDKFVVVNVTGFITFNGSLRASSPSGIFGASGPLFAYRLNADSGGGWWGNPGVYETGTVFRGLPPAAYTFTVAPQETITIDVIGEFSTDIDSGSAAYVFQEEGRQVSSTAVIVSIIS